MLIQVNVFCANVYLFTVPQYMSLFQSSKSVYKNTFILTFNQVFLHCYTYVCVNCIFGGVLCEVILTMLWEILRFCKKNIQSIYNMKPCSAHMQITGTC